MAVRALPRGAAEVDPEVDEETERRLLAYLADGPEAEDDILDNCAGSEPEERALHVRSLDRMCAAGFVVLYMPKGVRTWAMDPEREDEPVPPPVKTRCSVYELGGRWWCKAWGVGLPVPADSRADAEAYAKGKGWDVDAVSDAAKLAEPMAEQIVRQRGAQKAARAKGGKRAAKSREGAST